MAGGNALQRSRKRSATPGAASAAIAAGRGFVLVPGQRRRLGDQLYGQILDLIVTGKLTEGDRLPPEKAICEMFGVSRPTVREALGRLCADGLVQARQGAGTFVMSRPHARLKTFAATGDLAALLRCVEVRMPLESAAAGLAAERRSAADLSRILRAHEAFVKQLRAGTASEAADFAFHASIAAGSGNEFFPAVLGHLRAAMLGFMRLSLSLTRTGPSERAAQVVGEHAHIVDAISAQDKGAAEIAMQFHIGQARLRMIDRNRDG